MAWIGDLRTDECEIELILAPQLSILTWNSDEKWRDVHVTNKSSFSILFSWKNLYSENIAIADAVSPCRLTHTLLSIVVIVGSSSTTPKTPLDYHDNHESMDRTTEYAQMKQFMHSKSFAFYFIFSFVVVCVVSLSPSRHARTKCFMCAPHIAYSHTIFIASRIEIAFHSIRNI